MTTKVLSLLAVLFGVMAWGLLWLGERRLQEGQRFYKLQERIERTVPAAMDTYPGEVARIEQRIDHIKHRMGRPTGRIAAPVAAEAVDPRAQNVVDQELGRVRVDLADTLRLQNDLPTNPSAEALLWRKSETDRFEKFAKRFLVGRLKLKGKRLEDAKALLLKEYFRVQGLNGNRQEKQIRSDTDGFMKSSVYRNDAAGYFSYMKWRGEMDRLREKRRQK